MSKTIEERLENVRCAYESYIDALYDACPSHDGKWFWYAKRNAVDSRDFAFMAVKYPDEK